MSGRLSARFLLPVPDASLVHRALRPEARTSPGASLKRRGRALELRLQAATPSSLRSQVNAWLRLVEVATQAAATVPSARARKV